MRRHPEQWQCSHAATGSGVVIEEANTSAVMPERSGNLPNISYASLPSQMHSVSIVHVFFPELASFQLICKV